MQQKAERIIALTRAAWSVLSHASSNNTQRVYRRKAEVVAPRRKQKSATGNDPSSAL
ncbi:hypothetical protein [Cupriavidus necator]